ncbi:transforming growth factor-beta-induced protein ig-h3 [Aplysia californica]|uniref:Transforming growth factor-beta-induced protein ig-h3 n=1 Tax=Aplysia californica TaxID=6500 RepID=A0ABM0K8R3_APLCA|nr:transforming growth factor-beta-induced protein ig-h3 [Aplysia californica]
MKVQTGSFLFVCLVAYTTALYAVRRTPMGDYKFEMRSNMISLDMMARDVEEAERNDPNAPNIPELAQDIGLTTLVTEVGKAGLAETLSGPGPFTVFGPTNQAFSNLPDDVKKLIANTTVLAEVLKYHVLAGEVKSSQLKDELVVKTVEGSPLRVNIYDNGVYTTQCSPIDLKQVDKVASNGVVHVLNRVMLIPYGNIVQSVASVGKFNTLVTAVKAASLVEALSGPGPFTLFAPTDEAFMKLPPGTLEKLLKNPTELAAILKYHVVSKTYCSAGLTSGEVTTLNGASVEIKVNKKGVEVNNAKVISADLSVTNGVVHAIDSVLLPPNVDLSIL